MPFTGNIAWHSSPDPERPGYHLAYGTPEGVEDRSILVQDIGDSLWGWLVTDEAGNPLQMRNGYKTEMHAKAGVLVWFDVNREG